MAFTKLPQLTIRRRGLAPFPMAPMCVSKVMPTSLNFDRPFLYWPLHLMRMKPPFFIYITERDFTQNRTLGSWDTATRAGKG